MGLGGDECVGVEGQSPWTPCPSQGCAPPTPLSGGNPGGKPTSLACKAQKQTGRGSEAEWIWPPLRSCPLLPLVWPASRVQAPPSPDTGPLLKAPTHPRPAHPAAAAQFPNPCPASTSYPDPPDSESRYSPWPGTQAR